MNICNFFTISMKNGLLTKEGVTPYIKETPVLLFLAMKILKKTIAVQKAHMAKIIDFLEVQHEIPGFLSARAETLAL